MHHHPPIASMGYSSSDHPTPQYPPSPPSEAPPPPPITLVQPTSKKKRQNPIKAFRMFRSVFRSFPIITPAACKLPDGLLPEYPKSVTGGGGSSRITGTLFGYRTGRVSLSIQETSRTLPTLVLELDMQTHALQKELSLGIMRIALECEKQADKDHHRTTSRLLDEPVWTMYCNGKKVGYGVRREANEEDLHIMEVLKAVSMGAGALPGRFEVEGLEGELAYMRAYFERVVGSKDSETLYMLGPDHGNNGPDLSIFFVRI